MIYVGLFLSQCSLKYLTPWSAKNNLYWLLEEPSQELSGKKFLFTCRHFMLVTIKKLSTHERMNNMEELFFSLSLLCFYAYVQHYFYGLSLALGCEVLLFPRWGTTPDYQKDTEYQILEEHIHVFHKMQIYTPVTIYYFDGQNNLTAFICFSLLFLIFLLLFHLFLPSIFCLLFLCRPDVPHHFVLSMSGMGMTSVQHSYFSLFLAG